MDRSDDRWSNLREADKSQNNWNSAKRVNNKSGYKGVYPHKEGGYCAKLVVNRQAIYLGKFKDASDAHVAYSDAVKSYHGEFARS